MTRAALLLALCGVALACGKYGPPIRADQAKADKPTPRLEVPLPAPMGGQPSPAPTPEPEPEVEQEPPPEGSP